MRYSTLIPLLLAAGVANAQFGRQQGGGGNNNQNGQGQNAQGQNGQGQNGQNNNNQNGQGAGNNAALTLNAANVQTASQSDGFDGGEEAGQAKSVT